MDLLHSRELVQRPEAVASQTSREGCEAHHLLDKTLTLMGTKLPLFLGQAVLPLSSSVPSPYNRSGDVWVQVGTALAPTS